MDAPVLAFDQETRLRLLNPAAERVFSIEPAKHLGKTATELNLTGLLDEPSETVVQLDTQGPAAPGLRRPEPTQPARWMIRRGAFRQRGVPHTLVVLSDVSAALREEERLAWRRLIRVIGHEISNSLTPIKSIAGSLRSRLLPIAPRPPITLPDAADRALGLPAAPALPSPPQAASLPTQAASLQRDLQRGLGVIENRAESLNRFVQAYRQLAQLPAPVLRRVPLVPLLERVVSLEIRLDVRLLAAPDVELLADEDQIEQLLINLVRNAVESALSCADEELDPTSTVIPNGAERSDGPRVFSISESVRVREAPPSDLAFARSTRPCEPEVTIRATDDGDLVSIAIEDNGPGLANPENLFVPLYTTKKSGSGVGLALARQIVEAHGGVLSLRNKPDHQGCIAEVRIPIAETPKP
jgi:nitrogen fixation/metabolism regulation signal transduction histidine kinase